MKTTIQASENVNDFLIENGFKMNGFDYFKIYPKTDGENEWSEEVYVSNTSDGYSIWYPENEKRNKTYKRESSLIKYINRHHS